MAILKSGRKGLRASLIAGILSYTNCFAPHENPYPEEPWYDSMCGDFRDQIVLRKGINPDSLQAFVEQCEEECSKATEGESLRFCADIYCCARFYFGCDYMEKEWNGSPERFNNYELCMSVYGVKPLRSLNKK